MPTDTFFHLTNEKKEKIIKAAKEQFSKVPFSEVSIKKITQDANIARGSFYQYFISKEDLLSYILEDHIKKENTYIKEKAKEYSGDIFKIFISIYDYEIQYFINDLNKSSNFYKNIWQIIKFKQKEDLEKGKSPNKEKMFENYIEIVDTIDTSNLNINSKKDLSLLIELLAVITKKSVLDSFIDESLDEARNKYLTLLDYVKYGILKNRKEKLC